MPKSWLKSVQLSSLIGDETIVAPGNLDEADHPAEVNDVGVSVEDALCDPSAEPAEEDAHGSRASLPRLALRHLASGPGREGEQRYRQSYRPPRASKAAWSNPTRRRAAARPASPTRGPNT